PQTRAQRRPDRLRGCRWRDRPQGIPRTGASHRAGRLRHRFALAAGRRPASKPALAPPFFQPRVPRHRARAVPAEDELRGYPVPGQGDAAGGGGENSLDPAHRRPRVRREPALLIETGRVPGPRGADGMDGQDRFEGDAIAPAFVAGDVSIGRAIAFDLHAALSLAASIAAPGNLALPETQSPRAAARPFSRQVNPADTASRSRLKTPSVWMTVRNAVITSISNRWGFNIARAA